MVKYENVKNFIRKFSYEKMKNSYEIKRNFLFFLEKKINLL